MNPRRMRSSISKAALKTDDGKVLCLDAEDESRGGYGVVYKAHYDGSSVPVAVKFMQDPDVSGRSITQAKEIAQKEKVRFEHEIVRLEAMNDRVEGRPFADYYGRGIWEGRLFYVMEWLAPVNLLSLKTDDLRYKYAFDVCCAVSELHAAGYVHYDIKPANIMMREGETAGTRYVLVDFGSVHEIETVDRLANDQTVSRLSDGQRVYPHTPGYADPLEGRHTVNADIYAIGQVFRDMFPETVPPAWSQIIDRCISRNRCYRYPDVHSIICDLEKLKGTSYSFSVADDMHVWQAQKVIVKEAPVEMTWQDLRWELAVSTGFSFDEDYPAAPGVFSPTGELLIDFGKLKHRNIRISDPIHMTDSGLLVIRGNGRISIELDGTAQSDRDDLDHEEQLALWGEPVYPFVILLDGASLDNRTKLDNEETLLMYMVGRYCLLNFSSRSKREPADDPRFILTGRAGYSFVRNGRQSWKKGLYGILNEGCRGLFAQQKWDQLDLNAFLKTMRRIRRWRSRGDVQDWLENNVRNVLMRNLGRYDV